MRRRGLTTLEGQIGGVAVQILVDSGALGNFLSTDAARRCGLTTGKPGGLITLPDGSTVRSAGEVQIPLVIGTYDSVVNALVASLPGFDVILGQEWHKENRVEISWGKLSFRLTDSNGIQHDVSPGQSAAPLVTVTDESFTVANDQLAALSLPPGDTFELVSERTFSRDLARTKRSAQRPCFLGVLRMVERRVAGLVDEPANTLCAIKEGEGPQAPTTTVEGLQPILDDFAAVFQDEIPADERPEDIPEVRHSSDHLIDTGEARPINHRAYYLSAAKLEEQSRQIRSLLEKGHM